MVGVDTKKIVGGFCFVKKEGTGSFFLSGNIGGAAFVGPLLPAREASSSPIMFKKGLNKKPCLRVKVINLGARIRIFRRE